MLQRIFQALHGARQFITRELVFVLTIVSRLFRAMWRSWLRITCELWLLLTFVLAILLGVGMIWSASDELQGHPLMILIPGFALWVLIRVGRAMTQAGGAALDVLDGPTDPLHIGDRVRRFIYRTWDAVETPFIVAVAISTFAAWLLTPKGIAYVGILAGVYVLLARASILLTSISAQEDAGPDPHAVSDNGAPAAISVARLQERRANAFVRGDRFVTILRFGVLGVALLIVGYDLYLQESVRPGGSQYVQFFRTDNPHSKISAGPAEGVQPSVGSATLKELDRSGQMKYAVPVQKVDPRRGVGGMTTEVRSRWITQVEQVVAEDEVREAYEACKKVTPKMCREPILQVVKARLARWVILPVWDTNVTPATLTFILHDHYSEVEETKEFRVTYKAPVVKDAARDFLNQADAWLGVWYYRKATHQANLKQYLTALWNLGDADEQVRQDAIAFIEKKTETHKMMLVIAKKERELILSGKADLVGAVVTPKPGAKIKPDPTVASWVEEKKKELGPWVFYPLMAPVAVLIAAAAIIVAVPVLLLLSLPIILFLWLFKKGKGGGGDKPKSKPAGGHAPAAAAAH